MGQRKTDDLKEESLWWTRFSSSGGRCEVCVGAFGSCCILFSGTGGFTEGID